MTKKYITAFLLFSLMIGSIPANRIYAASLSTKLKGKILLQTESNGEAWYVNPSNEKKYFLGKPTDAFNLMRDLGIGITNDNLIKIQVADMNLSGEDADKDGLSNIIEDSLKTNKNKADSDGDVYDDRTEALGGYNPNGVGKYPLDNNFALRQSGKILLQVESNGEAWYINPNDNKRYFLGKPSDAFNAMRRLGLGITNKNLNEIPTNEINNNLKSQNNKSISSAVSPQNSQIWKLLNEYKDAINKTGANFNTLLSFSYKKAESTSEADCKALFPDKSFDECLQSFFEFTSGKEDINKLNENEVIIYENEKQAILTQKTSDSEINIFAVKTSGSDWKLLKIIHLVVNGSELGIDTDNDGRKDDDENCTNSMYKYFPEKCVKSDINKNDSDNDGWWDGIEIEADTNPNVKNENL